jgi:hypothetical protein
LFIFARSSKKLKIDMKRKEILLRKILLGLLLLVGMTMQAQVDIYGFSINVNDETQSGLVKFSSTDPESMQRVKLIEEWATAGAWGGDAYYAMLSYATYPKGLYIIDIETGEVLAGVMPPDDVAMVRAWIKIHREELFANWKLLSEEGTYFKIAPLR